MKLVLPNPWIAVTTIGLIGGLIGSSLGGCLGDDPRAVAESSWRASVSPEVVEGNPPCPEGTIEFKLDPPMSGTFAIGSTGESVTVDTDGVYFDWTSTIGMDAVIAKGGPNGNLYRYDPPTESFGDTDLASPINPMTETPYGLSHISFCYDFNLDVRKTADTTFTREWTWMIDKVGDQTDLLLQLGQTFIVDYQVTVSASAVDSNWAVGGSITISNPAPMSATITSVVDEISGYGAAAVDCGVEFPHVLAAGAELVCTYATDLPNGDSRTNVATVTTSGDVGGGAGEAAVEFATPTSVIDDCVDVDDDRVGALGSVCADAQFEYSLEVGGECGTSMFTNVASVETDDTQTTASDDHTVTVVVECEDVCTLTQGYWKTHSEYGPAPYDDTWATLADGADTPFFSTGLTYYEVLRTAPRGNACTILAIQWIAARLNVIAGADPAAIASTLTAGEQLFAGLDELGDCPESARAEILAAATTLDEYNNGLLGPLHCSE